MTRRHAWRGCTWQGDMHGRGHSWQEACMAGGVHDGGGGVHVVWHTCLPPILRDTVGQCADSTHPTGMHSCVL